MMSSQRSVLVVEDDTSIREGLVDAIESDGHLVVAVEDGPGAVQVFESRRFDLVLLDIMLPGINGYDVCRRIRENDRSVPIIMLTAKGEEIDKVLGLELGADDYVTKPFGVRELLARIHVAFRRMENHDTGTAAAPEAVADTFRFGNAEVDRRRYLVSLEGVSSPLSSRELQLLEIFHSKPGEVLSREELLNQVWGVDYYGTTRTLDQHIAQLRKKVAREHGLRLIRTVHGIGYKYVPQSGD